MASKFETEHMLESWSSGHGSDEADRAHWAKEQIERERERDEREREASIARCLMLKEEEEKWNRRWGWTGWVALAPVAPLALVAFIALWFVPTPRTLLQGEGHLWPFVVPAILWFSLKGILSWRADVREKACLRAVDRRLGQPKPELYKFR